MRLSDTEKDELVDLVVDAIWLAEKLGEPITLAKGRNFDVRLKRELKLGVRVHQTDVCVALNRAKQLGLVRTEESSDEPVVISLGSDSAILGKLLILRFN